MTDQHSFGDVVHQLFETTADKVNAVLATGAVLLPVWHPSIKEISDTAAEWTPILGGLWLCIQISSWTIRQVIAVFAWWRKF